MKVPLLERLSAWEREMRAWVPELRGSTRAVCTTCDEAGYIVAAGLSGEEPHEVRHALWRALQPISDLGDPNVLLQNLSELAPRVRRIRDEQVEKKAELLLYLLVTELVEEHDAGHF